MSISLYVWPLILFRTLLLGCFDPPPRAFLVLIVLSVHVRHDIVIAHRELLDLLHCILCLPSGNRHIGLLHAEFRLDVALENKDRNQDQHNQDRNTSGDYPHELLPGQIDFVVDFRANAHPCCTVVLSALIVALAARRLLSPVMNLGVEAFHGASSHMAEAANALDILTAAVPVLPVLLICEGTLHLAWLAAELRHVAVA